MSDDVEPADWWGVYASICRTCGKPIVIVATVESVIHGDAEAFEDGEPECMTCKNMYLAGAN